MFPCVTLVQVSCTFSAEAFIKLDEICKFEILQMECQARRSRAVFKLSRGISHAMRTTSCCGGSRGLRPSAAADEKKRPQACTHVHELSAK